MKGYLPIRPAELGETVRDVATFLLETDAKTTPHALLYAEKSHGFQCRTCEYAVAQNATHGRCAIMDGPIHLDNGCCAAWTADKTQLQLWRER